MEFLLFVKDPKKSIGFTFRVSILERVFFLEDVKRENAWDMEFLSLTDAERAARQRPALTTTNEDGRRTRRRKWMQTRGEGTTT